MFPKAARYGPAICLSRRAARIKRAVPRPWRVRDDHLSIGCVPPPACGGSDVRRVSADAGDEGDPVWSPDSLRIAFTANRDGQFDIFVSEIAGRVTRRFTTSPARDVNPSWSPDGRHITFASTRARGHPPHELYMMSANGTDPVRLTTQSGQWP